MAVINMATLRGGLARGQRLLGLDPGAKRIGVALTDAGLMLATPVGAIKRGKLREVGAALGPMIAREGVGGMVVGHPLSMDGTEGPAAQGVRDWAMALSDAMGLPVALWDERMSSVAANRLLVEADVSRRTRAAAVDGMAAAWMLQAALDATR